MLLFQGAAQPAGDKQIIASFAAPARYPAVSFDKTSDTNRNRNRTGCAARFAADDADFESLGRPAQAAIKPLHPLDLRFSGAMRVISAN